MVAGRPPTTLSTVFDESCASWEYDDADEGSRLLPSIASEDESFIRRLPARYVLAFWSFWGFVNMFTLRMDLNIAILAMVDDANHTDHPRMMNSTPDASCSYGNGTLLLGNGNTTCGDAPIFYWNPTQQNVALSAFYYGYFSTQILGGLLSRRYGAKIVLGLGLLINSVMSLLTPLAAIQGVWWLVALRVAQGLAQGLAQPCMHTMWSKWAPEQEKSMLMTITYAGCQLGTVVATWCTAYICEWDYIGGWPAVFYMFGGAGLLWSVHWLFLVYDTPETHPRISKAELHYLQENILSCNTKEVIPRPSWYKILKSPALWGIIGSHFANDWGCFALTVVIPGYLHHILKFEITQNGFLSSLPYIVVMVTNPLSGFLADWLRSRGILSTKNTRKLMNSIGLFIPSGLLFGLCFTDQRMLSILILTLALGLSGFTMAGFSVNHMDIAPDFAGVLFGLTNTIGTTTGFIGPAVLAYFTSGTQQDDIGPWRIFFFISAGIFFLGGLVFLLLAQGVPQDWGREASQEDIEDPAIRNVVQGSETIQEERAPIPCRRVPSPYMTPRMTPSYTRQRSRDSVTSRGSDLGEADFRHRAPRTSSFSVYGQTY